jgi:hypothetical protein
LAAIIRDQTNSGGKQNEVSLKDLGMWLATFIFGYQKLARKAG